MFTSSSCTSSAFEMISSNFLNIRHHHDHHRFNLLLVPTTGHVIDEQLFFCLHHLVRHHPKFLCTGGGRIRNYGVCGCESQINLSPFLSFSSEIKSAWKSCGCAGRVSPCQPLVSELSVMLRWRTLHPGKCFRECDLSSMLINKRNICFLCGVTNIIRWLSVE